MISSCDFRKLLANNFEPFEPSARILDIFVGYRGRYFSLSDIPRISGVCKWCFENETKTKRKHYCSPECELSAEVFCYPQRGTAKVFLSRRQGGRCAHCRCAFDGYVETETDHVIPIYKGGFPLGLSNVQLLCEDCHKIKTKEDMK